MKILSSFTHPQVVPSLYEFLSSVKHKIRYFKKTVNNQTVAGSHWRLDYGKKIHWKSMATSNCLVINNIQNLFCVQQKRETHTGLEQLEGENNVRIFILEWTKMASRLQGQCVVSEIKKALSYKSKAFPDDSITRRGGRANFPKHLQAFKGTPAVSWNVLRPDCINPRFLFTFKTRVLFSLSCTYSWSFLTNIPRLTVDLYMGTEHIPSNYMCCK